MARIRSIKPAFFTSEDTTSLSPLARLLFLGLLTEADRAGRLEDRPRQLKRRLLPDDECDVDALLWELANGTLIRRYEAAGGLQVIQITGFERHQKPHPKEAKSELPSDGRERKPELETASREKVFVHPVEHPSSPRRNGSGDLINGSGDLGAGAEVPAPVVPIISGQAKPANWGKVHGNHETGFCDWVCLPDFIFEEFRGKSGQGSESSAAYVRNWAQKVRIDWQARPIGTDNLKFWRDRWAESHPDEKPIAKPFSVVDAMAREAARKAGTR